MQRKRDKNIERDRKTERVGSGKAFRKTVIGQKKGTEEQKG